MIVASVAAAAMSKGDSSNKRKPGSQGFKQQTLAAWNPVPTPMFVAKLFVLFGVFCLPLGIAMLVTTGKLQENSVRYDNECNDLNATCQVVITIDTKMNHPVYVYYGLTHFYQNHFRYVKSRSYSQLKGDKVSSYGDLSTCDPVRAEDDSSDPTKLYLPCGLIAWSKFNDTFVMLDELNTEIPFNKDDIAWQSDIDKKFGDPPPDAPGKAPPSFPRGWRSFKDPDFVVWMRTAGLPYFRKLYAVIDQDLDPGTYTFLIQNNYEVHSFGGSKTLYLSEANWLGGKNYFLGISYTIVGSLTFLLAILIVLQSKILPGRKFGDIKLLQPKST